LKVAEDLGKSVGAPLVGVLKDETTGYFAPELVFLAFSTLSVILCIIASLLDSGRGGILNAGPEVIYKKDIINDQKRIKCMR
jgi:hypothetical protein